jgi:hypothetical protein
MAVVCHMDTSSHRIVARMNLEVCRHFGWRFISVTPCLIQLGIQRHTLWRRLGKHGGDFTNTAATLHIPPRTESVTPNKPRTQPLASTGGGGRQRTYQPNQTTQHPRGLGTCVISFQVTKGDTGSTPRYGWVTLRWMFGVVEHTHNIISTYPCNGELK